MQRTQISRVIGNLRDASRWCAETLQGFSQVQAWGDQLLGGNGRKTEARRH